MSWKLHNKIHHSQWLVRQRCHHCFRSVLLPESQLDLSISYQTRHLHQLALDVASTVFSTCEPFISNRQDWIFLRLPIVRAIFRTRTTWAHVLQHRTPLETLQHLSMFTGNRITKRRLLIEIWNLQQVMIEHSVLNWPPPTLFHSPTVSADSTPFPVTPDEG